ncbi:MAG: universal stress protein [Candidatus Binatia bacterium]|nr:universal stress protein [Candidatus Binatia bacterium]
MARDSKVNKVLVATDFSENAQGAIDWAGEVARVHGAHVELFHALQAPPLVLAPEIVPLPPEFYERDREHAEKLLAEKAEELRARGLQVETSLRSGSARDAILEEAARADVDLVVVGARGTTALERLLLGSVAARVVRDAACPVLAIPLEQVGAHRPIHRLLVPTDFSDDAESAVHAAKEILGPVADTKKVTLLHVWTIPAGAGIAWPAAGIEPDLTAFVGAARRQLEKAAEPLRAAGYDVETIEREGEPAHVIDEQARSQGADLIAMGTHGHSGLKRLFFGSVAERVLPAAPCPVLTVRRPSKDVDAA